MATFFSTHLNETQRVLERAWRAGVSNITKQQLEEGRTEVLKGRKMACVENSCIVKRGAIIQLRCELGGRNTGVAESVRKAIECKLPLR